MKIQIKNLTYQETALYHKNKYGIFVAGRRVGKTQGLANWFIENLYEKKSSGLWVDVTQSNIEKYVERNFRPILKETWTDKTFDRQKKILHFLNGSYLDFGSAERPELLEGFQYDFIGVNEAGLVLRKPNLWYNTLQPMCKNGIVRFVGTPKGKNLFHQLSIQENNNPEYFTFRLSAYDSPLWTKEQLDAIRLTTPELIFNQEYLADFTDDGSGVFRNVRNCIKPIQQLTGGETGNRYVMGVDLAKHSDFTVITVGDTATNNIVYTDRFNQLDWGFQKERIIDIHRRFNESLIIMDSTGVGDPIFDDVSRVIGEDKIQGYKFNSSSKKELIESLSIAIQNNNIYYPDIDVLIDELETYEIQVTRGGNISYNAPEGLHDDFVISLALCWQGLKPDNNNFSYVF